MLGQGQDFYHDRSKMNRLSELDIYYRMSCNLVCQKPTLERGFDGEFENGVIFT